MIKTGRIEFYDRPTAWGLIVGDDQELYVLRGRDGRAASPRGGGRGAVGGGGAAAGPPAAGGGRGGGGGSSVGREMTVGIRTRP